MESNMNIVLFHKNKSSDSTGNERLALWLRGVVWVHAQGANTVGCWTVRLSKYQDEIMA